MIALLASLALAETVRVEVTDWDGAVVASAAVHEAREVVRHRVDADGAWSGEALTLRDGTEVPFVRGMTLSFVVSAPGYPNTHVGHRVRKRNNVVRVSLEPACAYPVADGW